MARPSEAETTPGVAIGSLEWTPSARELPAEERIVVGAFAFLTSLAGLAPERARELGRAAGAAARRDEAPAFLEAFAHLGIGTLRIEASDPDRVVVRGEDLEGAHKTKAPACALALGFAEGAIGASLGVRTLGAETRCRSRGHGACTFVVMRR